MDWPNPKTFWSSVASVMVRSTAFGVSKITTGLRVGACNISFICESIHSQSALWRYCAGGRLQRQKCQEMRPWYHLKSEWVAEWHHRMHCHVYGTASNGMCKMWYHVPVSFPPFLGLASSILKHASNLQSNFSFYDLRKNFENDEAVQSRLAEPDGFISQGSHHHNESPHISWSPQHCASAHFAALALDPLFVKD